MFICVSTLSVFLLQRTNVDVIHDLYERKVLSHEFGFTNVSMGISLVKRGGYAFHCDNSYGNTFIMSKSNTLIVLI